MNQQLICNMFHGWVTYWAADRDGGNLCLEARDELGALAVEELGLLALLWHKIV